MKKHTYYLDLLTLRVQKCQSKKNRIWMYQLPDGKPEEIVKDGKYWHYNTDFGKVGCDSLAGAKGDLKLMGAKVWSVLQ